MSTYTVTRNDDPAIPSTGLSLRDAIILANANPGSTIVFAVTGTIDLDLGELQISASMSINGPGANILTVRRFSANLFRIFNIISNGLTVNISGLTIENGSLSTSSARGGGLLNDTTSTLTINECQFQNNVLTGIFSQGGAISTSVINPNILRLFNSTFNNNSSSNAGGALNIQECDAIIINCTINNNACSVGGGVSLSNDSTLTMINCTITQNTADNSGGGLFIFDATTSIDIGNTIVAQNTAVASPITSDIRLFNATFTSLGNNLYGILNNPTGPNDQFGTLETPLDPDLMVLANYGGPTTTRLPNATSPVIDTGSDALVITYFTPFPQLYVNGMEYRDQRNFYRIINITDIGAVEFGSTLICFSGKSMVLTKNIETGEIKEIKAKRVLANVHLVYDVKDNIFVPIVYNIVTGPINRFIKIKKDALGVDQPNKDFYVTSGHKIMIDGKAIKTKHIKQGKRVKVKAQKIYSICTEKQIAIKVNGLSVMTWGLEEFMIYSKSKNLLWHDNKVDI